MDNGLRKNNCRPWLQSQLRRTIQAVIDVLGEVIGTKNEVLQEVIGRRIGVIQEVTDRRIGVIQEVVGRWIGVIQEGIGSTRTVISAFLTVVLFQRLIGYFKEVIS